MAKTPPKIDKDTIRELAELLTETGLTEIEVEQDGFRLRVAAGVAASSSTVVQAAPQASLPQPVAAPGPAPAAPDDAPDGEQVKSPMVGTAYLAASPESAPFVSVGQTVTKGQTLLIIEAMKTMNQIPSPRAGKVAAVLVSDAQPVEFDEPLIVLE